MTTGKRAGSVISVKREGDVLVFNLHGPGEKDQVHTPIVRQLRFEPGKCSEKVRVQAMWHGFEQRLRDRAAKPCDTKTGKSASPEEKFKAIEQLAEWYATGTEEWNLQRGPQGPRESDDGQMLKAALGMLKVEKSAEEIHEFVEKLTKVQVRALLARKDVKEAVDLLRAQQAAESGVDTDALLEDF